MPNDLPTGTITFLFTDIEGSTQLWERYPEQMKAALARHDQILRRVIESCGGQVVKSTGDGAYAVFTAVSDAVAAALAAQRSLGAANGRPLADDSLTVDPLDPTLLLRIRIGIHTGEAELRDDDYHGTTLNRAARLMSIGHGGQILLSGTTAQLARGRLPPQSTLRELGQYRLRGLSGAERIYQLSAEGLPETFPPLNAVGVNRVNLPQPPTNFIGRWQEVDEILSLLSLPDVRLVTIIGPGGMGKTRLGIQAAATLAEREPDRFTDGTFFVSLAPLSAAEGIAGAIAGALGFQFSQGEREPHDQLIDYLRGRRALLVLDNFEHLLDSGGSVLPADIATAARDVSILVTSRARLGVQGEQLYPVPGMRTPDAAAVRQWADPQEKAEEYSAVQLFTQTAARIRPGFRLTRDNIADIARICRQVQGMPLAIVLAANWLELLSPAEIAAEMDHSLDVLATELRDMPDRQRSLRAVFNTTWQLASEHEREILPALSVFRAPFSREAAEAVAGAGLHDLLALVNKSWLHRVKGNDGVSRFVMHEMLRQYAEKKLRNDHGLNSVDDRYTEYYVSLITKSYPLLFGPSQKVVVATLAAEFDHIRVTWDRLVSLGKVDRLVDKLLSPLHRFEAMRGQYREVGRLVDQALDACRRQGDLCTPRTLAPLLIASDSLNYGDTDSRNQLEEAWRLVAEMETPESILGAWYVMLLRRRLYVDTNVTKKLLEIANTNDDDFIASLAAELAGEALTMDAEDMPALEQSVVMLRRAAEMNRQRGDQWAYASTCVSLSSSHGLLGNDAEALALLDEAQAIYENLGSWEYVATLAFSRADWAMGRGLPGLALQSWESAVEISREHGNRILENLVLGHLSINTVRYGDVAYALKLRERSLALARELAFTTNEPWDLWELGEVHRIAGVLSEARRYFEEAQTLFIAQSNRMGVAYYRRGLGDLALMGRDFVLAADHFAAALNILSTDFPHEIWSRGYMMNGLARALIGQAKIAEALDQVRSSLLIVRRHKQLTLQPQLLATVAELALAAGRAKLAVALCGLLAVDPLTWNETRSNVATLATRARSVLKDEAADAEAHGRSLDHNTLVAGLAAIKADKPDVWLDAATRLIDSMPIG